MKEYQKIKELTDGPFFVTLAEDYYDSLKYLPEENKKLRNVLSELGLEDDWK